MRLAATAAGLLLTPSLAAAQQTLPQMDFRNPLTLDQVWWMAAILIVLYFTLSRWGLPEIGKVLAHRDAVITADLEAARQAKAQADSTVAALNRTMNNARQAAHAEIAEAVAKAKAAARAEAAEQSRLLDAELHRAEAEIEAARGRALAAIRPVATETAAAILQRLTGRTPDDAVITPQIEYAMATQTPG